MKKSVLALAVLGAFAGAASAQSSVTLYGRIDAAATRLTPGDNVNDGDSIWGIREAGTGAGMGGSRWGFRGTEDLGGGLKAYFTLEAAFNSDDGSGPSGFARASYVGLNSNSLGDVRIGRQDTLSRIFSLQVADTAVQGELTIAEAPGGRPLFQVLGQRVNNSVGYMSPTFGGFMVQGLVGAGEGPGAARYQGISGNYKAGGLAASAVYESFDGFGDTYNKMWSLGANYNFGFATLFAAYQDTTDLGTQTGGPSTDVEDHQAWNLGVMVPFGALQFRAQYTNADYDLVGGGSEDTQKYGVSLRYALSKRTTLYSAITERDGDAKDDFAVKREITVLGIGHNF